MLLNRVLGLLVLYASVEPGLGSVADQHHSDPTSFLDESKTIGRLKTVSKSKQDYSCPTFSSTSCHTNLPTVQMKKIGLEIPESTRKVEDDGQNKTILRNDRSRRRILQCTAVQYKNPITNVCVLCTTFHARCTSCNSTGCLTCSNNYYIDSVTQICACDAPGYDVYSNYCYKCPSNCLACISNTTCQTCMDNYFKVSGQCVFCTPNCITCYSAAMCTTCEVDYGRSIPRTCDKCPVGYCATGTNLCQPATSPCASCTQSISQCTSCVAGFGYVDSTNKCRKSCPDGQYNNAAGTTCLVCTSGCSKCVYTNSKVYCLECLSTHVLLPTYSCQLYAAPDDTKYRLPSGLLSAALTYNVRFTRNFGAPDGYGRYTINPTTLAYMPCAAPMSTCVRLPWESIPTRCNKTTAFFNNSCVAKFASGFVNSTSMQVVASPDPKVLFYDSTGPLACARGYVLKDGECKELKCLAGYYFNSATCTASANFDGCLNINELNKCTKCDRNFFLSTTGACTQCSGSCQVCVNATAAGCLLCAAGFQLRQDGACAPTCPTEYTLNTTLWACWPGNGKCRTYLRDEQCTGCYSGYVLTDNATCELVCAAGKYLDGVTKSCMSCPLNCLDCDTQGICILCARGTELVSGLCQTPTCAAGCVLCSGSSSNQCFKAATGYYLNYSNEVVKYTPYCDYGKYYDSTLQTCKLCDDTCDSCTGPLAKDCLDCSPLHFRYGSKCLELTPSTAMVFQGKFSASGALTTCSDTNCNYCPDQSCEECKAGFYPVNGICQACSANSTYCLQSTGQSISCKGGYTMIERKCLKNCRSGFARLTETSEECTPCPSNCQICADLSMTCVSCLLGDVFYFPTTTTWNCTNNQDVSFNGYYLVGNTSTRCTYPAFTCTSATIALSCLPGYYLTSSSCTECADRCLTCSGAASNCTSCHMGYTYDGALGTCTAVCERYEYLDTASLECIPCSRNCRTCDATGDGTQCTDCFDGFYLLAAAKRCMPCAHGCITCSAASCTVCAADRTLSGGLCKRVCPAGMYYDWMEGACKLCNKFCGNCVGPTMYNCTTCLTNIFDDVPHNLTTDQPVTTVLCRKICLTTPSAYVNILEAENDCDLACDMTCLTCSGYGPNACLTCPPGRFLDGFRCVMCHPNCKTCNGTAVDDCLTCVSPLTVVNGWCYRNCYVHDDDKNVNIPYDFNPVNQGCLPACNAKCGRWCISLLTTGCVTCPATYPNQLVDGTCIKNCTLGTYEPSQKICLVCHADCASCYTTLRTDCITCKLAGYFIQPDRICRVACDPATYQLNSTHCAKCHPSCGSCTSDLDTGCLSCSAGNYRNPNGTCQSTCPIGYIKNTTTFMCLPCGGSCETCSRPSDPYACLTCPVGRYKRPDNFCAINCTIGSIFVDSLNSCQTCGGSCETCSRPSDPYACLTCPLGRYKRSDNFCAINCTAGNYFSDPLNSCQICHPACLTCHTGTDLQCDECALGFLRSYTNACVSTCPLDTVQVGNFCKQCHSSCGSCRGETVSDCLTCKTPGYFIQPADSVCRPSCDPKTFRANSTHCLACHVSCMSCTNALDTSCISCSEDYYLNPDSTCKLTCPFWFMKDKTTHTCLTCSESCRECIRPNDPYACSGCVQERFLRSDGYCAINCVFGYYFDDQVNACLKCHPACRSCKSGSLMDCDECAVGLLRSYSYACVSTCPWDSVPVDGHCKRCHPSCEGCKGETVYDCLSCESPKVLTTDGECSTECGEHDIADQNRVCQPCHATCASCWNTEDTGCITCRSPEVAILSVTGQCIDCLKFPELDTEACWYSVPLSLIDPPARSLALKVSTTVKLSFPQQTLFMRRLSMEKLAEVLNIKIPELAISEWSYTLRYESGDLLIDLIFSESKSFNVQLQVSPKFQIVLLNNKTGVAELIFWNTTATYQVPVHQAPDEKLMNSLEAINSNQAAISNGANAAQLVMTVVAIFSASGAGGILLKFLQVFKLLSRLRLLNVYFGSYLEVCLRVVAGLYPLGGDNITNQVVRLTTKSRGKLDTYKISVLSADVMAIKYCAYFALLAIRIYRSKVRYYATQRQLIGSVDFLIDTIGEKVRTLIIAMVGIDIVFYSLRCLSHMDLKVDDSFDASVSFFISCLTLTVMTADLILLYSENSATTFSKLRLAQRLKRVVLAKDLVETENKELQKKVKLRPMKDNNTEAKLVDTGPEDSKSTRRVYGKRPLPSLNKEDQFNLDGELQHYLYGYRQQKRVIDNPSAEQFFGNGIKLHKLRTPEGRYYNTIAMMKLLLFEPIFINFQLFPSGQMLLILILQLAYVGWVARAGLFVRVFESKLSIYSALSNELAVLIFLFTGTVFSMMGGVGSLNDKSSAILQFTAIGCIVLAAGVGFFEFIGKIAGIIISTIKNRKLGKLLKAREQSREQERLEQGLVRHRVIGRDLPGAEPPVPPVDADMSSSVADIKANQVGQSAKPVLGKTRLAPGKRLSRPPLQPLARK